MEITPEIQALLDKQKADMTAEFETATAGLKESQQKLLAEKKAEQEAKDAAAAEAERAKLEKATKDKDIETLTSSYDQKLKALQEQNDQLTNGIKQGKISDLASGFVDAHVVDDAFSKQAMKDVYSKRVDIRDGKPVVLDAEGNLTALTVEDLNKEILSSSLYSNHIRASKANGGGVNGSRNAGGAGNKKYSEMSLQEKADYLRANPPKRTG